MIERFTRGLVRWRYWLLALALLVSLAAWAPSRRVEYDRAIENMFAPDDPLLAPYALVQRTFGGSEIVLAAYRDPALLTPAGLARLGRLAAELQAVPGVAATLSLGSSPLKELLADPAAGLGGALVETFSGYLLGSDRQTTAVVCQLAAESERPRAETIAQMRHIVRQHDANGVVVGEPVMVVDGFGYLEADGRRLGWISTTLLLAVILYCFRSLRWVVVPLAVVQFTLLLTGALVAWAELRLSLVSSMLTSIVTIVGIAATVHLIVRFRELRATGRTPQDALALAAAQLGPGIFWAALTDTAGFGALMVARVGPVHDFGLMSAVGLTLVLVSLALVVPGLSLLGRRGIDPRRAWGEDRLDLGLAHLSHLVQRRPLAIGAATLAVVAIAAAGCFKLEVETDFTKNFRTTSPIVTAYRFVEDHLGGAGVWDCVVPAPATLDAEFLARVRRLQRRLRAELGAGQGEFAGEGGLTKVLSLVDLIDVFPLGGQLPADAVLGAMATQMPAFTAALVGVDPDSGQRWLRIALRSRERQSSAEKQHLIDSVQRLAAAEFPQAQTTGIFILLANLIDSTTADQWRTFALSTVALAVLMTIAFGSLKLSLISLVPNALPVFVVTGLGGWLGLRMNMGAAMIAAVSMGLSIDSSTHYILEFLSDRARGLSVSEALHAANHGVGRAMILSTAALVAGFSALCASDFVPTIYFGALTGLTMIGGLAGNLIVLPLLLLAAHRGRRNRQ